VKKKLLIVDDDQDLVSSMKELFEVAKEISCITATSLDELRVLENELMFCSLAIVDINLGHGKPSGIDVYRWLIKKGFSGRIVFLTGHAKSHPLVAQASLIAGVKVCEKPFEVSKLLALWEGK
jgi:DNA-binding NtrC family response regulator